MPELLTPGEVSTMFRVDRKTPARWHKAGKLVTVRTPGGHRRYVRFQVEALISGRALTREETTMLQYLTRGQS